jgi:exopolysaccharide biosynthesis predicted pyruvyltransferase EpsI
VDARDAGVGLDVTRVSASAPADLKCLIAGLNERIDAALRPAVPADRPYALVDFPNTSNVGDSAIWLGELEWLRRNGFGEPLHTCSSLSFSPRVMRRRVPSGATILLSGGGNFGDLYLNHQRLRETIVRKFADCRIVQLPQSIHYQTDEAVERTRSIYDDHPDLIIFTRDPRSFELVRSTFRAAVRMCPDMALCLGPIARPRPPT